MFVVGIHDQRKELGHGKEASYQKGGIEDNEVETEIHSFEKGAQEAHIRSRT